MLEAPTRDPYSGAAGMLKALASPIRLAAVMHLSRGPLCVHELQAALRREGRDVSQPLLSQHLRVLRTAGLVTTTRQASEVTYRLSGADVGHLVHDAIRHTEGGRR